jgi:hypothetical protein
MSALLILLSTFTMMAGSVLFVSGVALFLSPQEALGRLYLAMTSMGAPADHNSLFVKLLGATRGNDALKKRNALLLTVVGMGVGFAGAAIFPI